MKIKTITAFGLLLISANLLGQTDTLATVIFKKSEAESLQTIGQYWNVAALWISAIAAVIIPILSYFALRSRIDKWADEAFSKKASEKVGVDWGIVKNLVDERRALLQKRSAIKIAVINQKLEKKGVYPI